MKVIWSPPAIKDLTHLRSYIAQDNPSAAAEVAKTILAAIENLRRFPSIGRPGRVPDTRELVVPGSPFILPYTVTARGIEIIAVLHGAQKWPREPKD
jgi:addiction module RelE/StbE family toxin